MRKKPAFILVAFIIFVAVSSVVSFLYGKKQGSRDVFLMTSKIGAITTFSIIENCRNKDKDYCLDLLNDHLDTRILELDGYNDYDQERKSTVRLFKRIGTDRKKYPRKKVKGKEIISDKIEEILNKTRVRS